MTMPKPTMTFLGDVADTVPVQKESTVSRGHSGDRRRASDHFAFDAGQVLTEHTAAMPVILQTLDGHVRITADERTVDLVPGGLVHMDTRLPHSVEAVTASRLVLTMMDHSSDPEPVTQNTVAPLNAGEVCVIAAPMAMSLCAGEVVKPAR